MHPAERDGYAAGRAAAIADRAGDIGRAVGAELLLAAKESALNWADGAPLFIDQAGTSVKVYIESYMTAYDRWMEEHPAAPRPDPWQRRANG